LAPLVKNRSANGEDDVPAVLFLAAGGLMLKYKLTRSRLAEIQAELRQIGKANKVTSAGLSL
jgi:Na+/melibiose symporter-like transporter